MHTEAGMHRKLCKQEDEWQDGHVPGVGRPE